MCANFVENIFHWKVWWNHVSDEWLKVFSFWSCQQENPNYCRRVGVQTYFHMHPLLVKFIPSLALRKCVLPAVSMPISVRPVIVTWTLEFELFEDSETEIRDPECIQSDVYSFYANWVKKMESWRLRTRTAGKPFTSNSLWSLSKCPAWNLLKFKLSIRNIPSILATITSLFTCYWNVKVNSLLWQITHRQASPMRESFRIIMYRVVSGE